MIKSYMIFAIYILATVLIYTGGSAKKLQEPPVLVSCATEPYTSIDPDWAEVLEPTEEDRNDKNFKHYKGVFKRLFEQCYGHVVILVHPDVCPPGLCPGVTFKTDVGLYFEYRYQKYNNGNKMRFLWMVPWREDVKKGTAKLLIDLFNRSFDNHHYQENGKVIEPIPQWVESASKGYEYDSHLVILTRVDKKMYIVRSEKLISEKLKKKFTAIRRLRMILKPFLKEHDINVGRSDENSFEDSESRNITVDDDESARREEMMSPEPADPEPLALLKTLLKEKSGTNGEVIKPKYDAIVTGFFEKEDPKNGAKGALSDPSKGAPSDLKDEFRRIEKLYNRASREDKKRVEAVLFELGDPGVDRFLQNIEKYGGDKFKVKDRFKNSDSFPRIYTFEKDNFWAEAAKPSSVTELKQTMNYYFQETPNFIVSTIKKLIAKAEQMIVDSKKVDATGQDGPQKRTISSSYSIFLIDYEPISDDYGPVMENLSKLKGHPDPKGNVLENAEKFGISEEGEKYFGLVKKIANDIVTDIFEMLIDMWKKVGQFERASLLKKAEREARNDKTKSTMFPCVIVFNGSELIGTLWPRSASEMRQVISNLSSDNLDLQSIVGPLMGHGEQVKASRSNKNQDLNMNNNRLVAKYSSQTTVNFRTQLRKRVRSQEKMATTTRVVSNSWQSNPRHMVAVGAA